MNKNLSIILVLLFIMIISAQSQETGTFTDLRDGHIYKSVIIGNQTWMAENLVYLPQVNLVSDSRYEEMCIYVYGYNGDNLSEAKSEPSYKKYGALYNWEAAIKCCPAGWHLPSDNEWRDMETNLGMKEETFNRDWRRSGDTGKKLKSISGWNMDGATDEAGFHCLPAGCRGYQGFESQGFCAYFWTSSPAGSDNAWRRGVCGDDNGTCREEERKYFGISVRCIKN